MGKSTVPFDIPRNNDSTAATELGIENNYRVFEQSIDENGSPLYKLVKIKAPICHKCKKPMGKYNSRALRTAILSHYKVEYQDNRSAAIAVPVTLEVALRQWTCEYCNKVRKWDDCSDLRAPSDSGKPSKEKATVQLKAFLQEVSVQSDLTALAKHYNVGVDYVRELYTQEVKRRDSLRSWVAPQTLGLYTITLKNTAKITLDNIASRDPYTAYCLCVDVEKQTVLDLFCWGVYGQPEHFFDRLQNPSNVKRILVSVDDAAADAARHYFPSAEITVDKIDVKERFALALRKVKLDAGDSNPTMQGALNKNGYLIDTERPILPNTADWYARDRIESVLPTVRFARKLRDNITEVYSSSLPDATDALDEWIAADKSTIPPFQALEPSVQHQHDEILSFIPAYAQVDRKEYENLLDIVRHPLENLLSKKAYNARAAGWDYLYGHVVFGVMDRVNYKRLQERGEARKEAIPKTIMAKQDYMFFPKESSAESEPQLITYENFAIPMQEFAWGLTMIQEIPVCTNIPPMQMTDDDWTITSTKGNAPMNGFDKVLADLREASTSLSNQGTLFERLVKQFLQISPLYSRIYDKVWLWAEFPYNGNEHDSGIDLVAHVRGGEQEYCAIQAKFYAESHAVQKADVDTFLSASGKPFYVNDEPVYFTQRLIVSTTDKWSSTAESTIIGQRPPVNRIRLQDFRDSGVDWDSFALSAIDQMKPTPKKKPRPHQTEAIQSVLSGFAEHDRGKLIMACGTGKTFTGLKIAEEMTQGKGSILVLVPSISLLNQTLAEWAEQCAYPYATYAICSDPKASKVGNTDMIDGLSGIVDAIIPATTNVNALCRQYDEHKGDALQLFFSTYQSINVIHDFQQQSKLKFDLIICDEAHRTTGVTLAGEDESNFVRVHDNNYISAAKRLYMTATPRIYGDATKLKADQNDAVLCSMDDTKVYGEEFYRLGFSDAVSQGLLSDYKVIVLAVDEAFVSRSLQKQLTDSNNELTLDDAVKIIGCMNGLAKKTHFPGEDNYFVNDPHPMRRAVAFTQTIAQSKQFVSMFEEIQALYKINTSDGDGLTVELKHVDGSDNALVRKNSIEWLKQDAGENYCRVLSNARCLSEGVDVPALDAVMFLNPRKSIGDIIQSVGRVMRKSEGKQYGYIILPIGIPAGVEPEQALSDNTKYKIVWDVLQALRAHDDRFNNTVNRIELNKNKPDNIAIIGVTGNDDFDSSTPPPERI